VLSGDGDAGVEAEAMKCGANRCRKVVLLWVVKKPIQLAALNEIFQDLMKNGIKDRP
jgi:hypothetical protein